MLGTATHLSINARHLGDAAVIVRAAVASTVYRGALRLIGDSSHPARIPIGHAQPVDRCSLRQIVHRSRRREQTHRPGTDRRRKRLSNFGDPAMRTIENGVADRAMHATSFRALRRQSCLIAAVDRRSSRSTVRLELPQPRPAGPREGRLQYRRLPRRGGRQERLQALAARLR